MVKDVFGREKIGGEGRVVRVRGRRRSIRGWESGRECKERVLFWI